MSGCGQFPHIGFHGAELTHQSGHGAPVRGGLSRSRQPRSRASTVLAIGDASEQRDLAAGVSARIARQRILTQPVPRLELIVA